MIHFFGNIDAVSGKEISAMKLTSFARPASRAGKILAFKHYQTDAPI